MPEGENLAETISQKGCLDNLTREKELAEGGKRRNERLASCLQNRRQIKKQLVEKKREKNTDHLQRHSVLSDLEQRR